MLRKTYYFEQPSYLSVKLDQLVISRQGDEIITRPLDDAGIIVIDQPQTSLTIPLLQSCAEKQIAIIVCDDKHLPAGVWLPLSGHNSTGGRTRAQLECSRPLKKQLWQITVRQKIANQAAVFKSHSKPHQALSKLAASVRSGDPTNAEAQAAAFYWKNWMPEKKGFIRDPMGEPPNYLLNFAYAILRSTTARCLIGAGLWPVYGIFHRNQYNHLPLADDIMEPYRPFADALILDLIEKDPELLNTVELRKDTKLEIVNLINADVNLEGIIRPMQVAMQLTCASLAACFEEKSAAHLKYPTFA